MPRNLYPESIQTSLDTFIHKMSLLQRADNPPLVAKIIVKWTQGQTLLTKKLLQYILQETSKIVEGEEAIAVEKVIRNRLLKEFKQDELTFIIRKSLYQKDLDELLEVTEGELSHEDRIYLIRSQENLGLRDEQCRSLERERLLFLDRDLIRRSLILAKNGYTPQFPPQAEIPQLAPSSSFADSSGYVSDLAVISPSDNARNNSFWNLKWLLWILWTPLLFLALKGFVWFRESSFKTSVIPKKQYKKVCVDLTSRRSPRMSLGEKLLTREYSQLKPESIIAFHEGVAAFAQCEFSSAQDKLQNSLALDNNNPEATIYYNNAEAIAEDYFKLAVTIPLSSQPGISWEILRGIAQAQAEINQKGGIKNKLLLIQIVNQDNNPNTVRELAQQIAQDKSIVAVVGHNDYGSLLTAAKIYEENKLVMVSPTSTYAQLSGVGSHIMMTMPNISALVEELTSYAADNSLDTIAVCVDSQDSASTSFVEEFIAQTSANGRKTEKISCDFAQENWQPESIIAQAEAKQVDGLLLAPSVNHLERAIAVARANQQQLPLLGNHTLYTYKTLELGQEAMEGMVIPSPWLFDHNSEFSRVVMQYWSGKVNWRTAMAYDAVEAIAQGLEKSSNPSQLQTTLNQPSFSIEGATGDFLFAPSDRQKNVRLAIVEKSSNPRSKYQFTKLKL